MVDESEGIEVARRAVGDRVIVVIRGDLTRQRTDVVVNAANEQLQHGGGVAAALAKGGGPRVQQESDDLVAEHGPVRAGTAALTTAGDLPADYIVHVVGPRFTQEQDNEALLRQAVNAALDSAQSVGGASVALPAISAGIFGYPRNLATAVIADEVGRFLEVDAASLREVRLVGYDQASAADFAAALG